MCLFCIWNKVHEVKVFPIIREDLVLIATACDLTILVLFIKKGVALGLAVEGKARDLLYWGKWRVARLSATSLEVWSSSGHYSHRVHRAGSVGVALGIIVLDHLKLLIASSKFGGFVWDFRKVLIRLRLRLLWDIVIRSLMEIYARIVLHKIVLELSSIRLFSQILWVVLWRWGIERSWQFFLRKIRI